TLSPCRETKHRFRSTLVSRRQEAATAPRERRALIATAGSNGRYSPMRPLWLSRRSLLASVAASTFIRPAFAAGAPGDAIRKLVIVSAAQASDPQEFQAAQLLAQAWRQLGLDIEVRGMPRPQLADLVWYKRDTWDMTMWRMVGRPERSDPDEFA